MNPNSQHQMWSKWTWQVRPGRLLRRSYAEVQTNCARFGRKAFGAASQMRIHQTRDGWAVECLTEGHPVNDESFRSYMAECWETFFIRGFGIGTVVKMTVQRMAGSPENGKPADQLIMMPARIEVN